MDRKNLSPELRERQELIEEATKDNGDWCMIGFSNQYDHGFELLAWNYTKEKIVEIQSKLEKNPQFTHISDFKVLSKKDFEVFCNKRTISYEFPPDW